MEAEQCTADGATSRLVTGALTRLRRLVSYNVRAGIAVFLRTASCENPTQ